MASNRKVPAHPSAQMSFSDINPEFGVEPCPLRRRPRRSARPTEDMAASHSASDSLLHGDTDAPQPPVSSCAEEDTCGQTLRESSPNEEESEGASCSHPVDELPQLESAEHLLCPQDRHPTTRGP